MSLILLLTFSYVSFSTGSGSFNLYSARTLPMTTLAFNAHLTAARQNFGSRSHFVTDGKFGFTYGVVDPLEIYLGATVYSKYAYSNAFFSPDETEFEMGWKNIYGGIKFYLPIVGGFLQEEEPVFKWLVGGHIGTAFNPFEPTNKEEILMETFYPGIRHAPDFALDLLSDLEIYPLLVHLNGGYVKRGKIWKTGSIIPGGESRPSLIRFGGGLELAAGSYTRFLFEVKDIIAEEDNPDTLIGSFGIRFLVPRTFSFDLGVDYVFNDSTDFVPDALFDEGGQWRYRLGFTIQSTLIEKKKEEKPKKGVISLMVTDQETNEPLIVTVSFEETGLSYQTGEDGKIDIEIDPGVYKMKLSKEGYLPKEASITVKSSSTISINTVLRREKKEVPVVETGIFTGTVSAFREETPLLAKIEFLGTEIPSIASDGVSGVFKKELEVGTYNVRISADGYLPETFPIEIKKGETTIKNVKLVKKLEKEEKIVLQGINFPSGKATIPPDQYPILDKVVEILKANENVKVEISGHTDSVGDEAYNLRLSELRAESVKNYLVQRGISPIRLTTRGYGETQPIAPNTTREGRWQNRRIEFKVIATE
ncbi:MAG: OmpA family protein [candidate division WOR-3 bacterium]